MNNLKSLFKDFVLYALLGALVTMVFLQHQKVDELREALTTSQSIVQAEIHSYNEELGRASVKVSNSVELFDQVTRDLSDNVRADLESFNAQVVAVTTAVAKSNSSGGGKIVYPAKPHRSSVAIVTKESVDEPPVAESPFLNEGMYDDYRLHVHIKNDELTYRLTQSFEYKLIEGQAGTATPYYLSIWELDENGDRIEPKLQIKKFEVIVKETSPVSLRWFDPRLDLAFEPSVGLSSGEFLFRGSLGISLASYGGDDEISWRFGRVGVLVADDVGVTWCPAMYNVSRHIPPLTNVWVGSCYNYLAGEHGLSFSIGGVL